MEALEALLVRCTVDQCATPTTEDLLSEVRNHELLGDETVGAFRKILDEGDAIPLLQTGLVKLSPLLEKVDSSLNWIEKLEAIVRLTEGPDGATKDVRVGFFLVAVSSLLTFARANISGPPLEIAENPERYNPKLAGNGSDDASDDSNSKKWLLTHMSVDGEDVIGKPLLVGYMCTASAIFRHADGLLAESKLATLPLWRMRTLHLHQKLLSKNAASLKKDLIALANQVSQQFKSGQGEWGAYVLALVEIECAMVMQTFQCANEAAAFIQKASATLGIEMQQTGVMGKRTVYQVDPKAQMVLLIEHLSKRERKDCEAEAADAKQEIPQDWLLEGLDEEDILLLPKLEGETDSMKGLNLAEQALVLALLVQVSKNQAQTEIQSWEMMAYVQCIFKQTRPGALSKMAATLHATRFEKDRNRTRERALVRIEKLVEALALPTPPARTRIPCLFSVSFPPMPQFQKEYGEQLIANAMVGNALIVFEKFEHWDNLILCYQLLQKTAQAQKLINERLEESPDDPRLWCALGDVTRDDSCYVEAWKRSGQRHARAQRSLAASAMRSDDYASAIDHWEKALALNPLYPSGWFAVGYCYMREDREDEALQAFTRVTQLDSDNAEAWNNLAALHMKQRSWRKAFAALKEAVRLRRESWQLWDNYVEAALRCGYTMLAVHGIEKIISLERCQSFNLSSLDLLLDIISEAKGRDEERRGNMAGKDSDEKATEELGDVTEELTSLDIEDSDDDDNNEGESKDFESDLPLVGSDEWCAMEQKVLDILKKFAGTSAAGHELWHILARYYKMVESWSRMKEMCLKESRALLGQQWKGEQDLFAKIVVSSRNLIDAAIKCVETGVDDKGSISSLKYHFKGILKQATNYFEDTPEYDELGQILEKAEAHSN